MSLPQKEQNPITREEIKKAHCENQDCNGCPAEFEECARADEEEIARQEEEAYNEMDEMECDY